MRKFHPVSFLVAMLMALSTCLSCINPINWLDHLDMVTGPIATAVWLYYSFRKAR